VATIHFWPIRLAMTLLLGLLVLPPAAIAAAEEPQNDGLSAARSLLERGRNREAISLLKDVLASQPELKGVNHDLGVAYYREGEYLEAARYLDQAWKENAEDHDAAQLLGLSNYFSGRPAEAIPPLEKVRSWRTDRNIDAVYVLGVCYAIAKRYSESLGVVAQLYGVSPESATAHLLLGRILLRQGFDPVAERELTAALLLSPKLPLAHLALGELSVYGGDYRKAVREFQEELAVNPACAPALTHLGEVYWRLNRDQESERVLRRSIGLDPADPAPYVVLGKVLIRAGRSALAEQSLHRAAELDPGNYSAHYFLGRLYRNQGRPEAAQREMKAAARIQQLQAGGGGRN
jgi:tetratricopeptide (TPR) repeat protein